MSVSSVDSQCQNQRMIIRREHSGEKGGREKNEGPE